MDFEKVLGLTGLGVSAMRLREFGTEFVGHQLVRPSEVGRNFMISNLTIEARYAEAGADFLSDAKYQWNRFQVSGRATLFHINGLGGFEKAHILPNSPAFDLLERDAGSKNMSSKDREAARALKQEIVAKARKNVVSRIGGHQNAGLVRYLPRGQWVQNIIYNADNFIATELFYSSKREILPALQLLRNPVAIAAAIGVAYFSANFLVQATSGRSIARHVFGGKDQKSGFRFTEFAAGLGAAYLGGWKGFGVFGVAIGLNYLYESKAA